MGCRSASIGKWSMANEAEHPDPSIYPDDPALRFLAALLEEFGDEWCNKLA